jgi:thiol-disulfide isomerase/thioredoxin
MTMERVLARVPDYAQRTTAYQPDASVVEMMKSYVKPEDRIEVFMGTWCSDSQREVPKLLRILGDLKSQGVEIPATFFALDRSKQKPAALVAGKDVQKVATFIYYRGDRELGRIVERPQGVFEDDLLALAAAQ